LICAGDIGFDHILNEDFFVWFSEQPARYKVFIQGNHDRAGEMFETVIKEKAAQYNLIYLHHNQVEIEGYKLWGSNYSPRFGRWAWMRDRGYPMYYEWEQIPKDTNILVTHGPPWGVLDLTPYGENVGCEELRDRLKDLKKLKLLVTGHIHQGAGIEKIGKVQFVNASICTESYQPINKVIKVKLK
jgi:Icc-related predicted phosphoesterase